MGGVALMSAQHTPGPWWLQADGAGWYVECTPERGHSVAYVRAEAGEDDPDTPDAEKEANARLIAAAPDLLEALWAMVTSFHAVEYMEPHMQEASNMARAAIAKAEGGAA